MRRPAVIAALLLVTAAGGASACSIPVFRFAFENWKPAPYEVFVFRRGPLTEVQQKCVQRLRDATTSNVTVIDVDLGGKPESKHLKVWEKVPPGQKLPLLAVRASDADPKWPLPWLAPLDDGSVTDLLD